MSGHAEEEPRIVRHFEEEPIGYGPKYYLTPIQAWQSERAWCRYFFDWVNCSKDKINPYGAPGQLLWEWLRPRFAAEPHVAVAWTRPLPRGVRHQTSRNVASNLPGISAEEEQRLANLPTWSGICRSAALGVPRTIYRTGETVTSQLHNSVYTVDSIGRTGEVFDCNIRYLMAPDERWRYEKMFADKAFDKAEYMAVLREAVSREQEPRKGSPRKRAVAAARVVMRAKGY